MEGEPKLATAAQWLGLTALAGIIGGVLLLPQLDNVAWMQHAEFGGYVIGGGAIVAQFVLALAAVVTGTYAARQAGDGGTHRRGRGRARTGVVLGGVALSGVLILAPMLWHFGATSRRSRQLSMAGRPVPELLQILGEPDVERATAAIRTLAIRGGKPAVLPLVQRLADPVLGQAAFEGLERMGVAAVPMLCKHGLLAQLPLARMRARTLLKHIPREQQIKVQQALGRMVAHQLVDRRRAAAWACVVVGQTMAPALQRLLPDPDPEIQRAVTVGLLSYGWWSPQMAFTRKPQLEAFARDPFGPVRDRARDIHAAVLRAIVGLHLPFDRKLEILRSYPDPGRLGRLLAEQIAPLREWQISDCFAMLIVGLQFPESRAFAARGLGLSPVIPPAAAQDALLEALQQPDVPVPADLIPRSRTIGDRRNADAFAHGTRTVVCWAAGRRCRSDAAAALLAELAAPPHPLPLRTAATVGLIHFGRPAITQDLAIPALRALWPKLGDADAFQAIGELARDLQTCADLVPELRATAADRSRTEQLRDAARALLRRLDPPAGSGE